MKFDSRETYIAAVITWKSEYKDLSKLIRVKKLEVKDCYRHNNSSAYRALSYQQDLSDKAREMLAERGEGKVEAQRQYLLSQTVTS